MGTHEPSIGGSDEWYTPKYVFDALGVSFDLDVAAPIDRAHIATPAAAFLSADSLNAGWSGFVWMNPPFGGRNGLVPWLEKFMAHGHGVALVPDRTSAPWWQSFARQADAILFVDGKIKFLRPDGSVGASPSNGTTLLAKGSAGVNALRNAQSRGLGTLFMGAAA